MEMILQTPHGADDLMLTALTGVFDPLALIPDADEARLSALATVAVEQALNGRWYWSLTTDARRAGLARLPPDPAARRALFEALPLLDGDDLGAAIRAALGPRPDDRVSALLADGEAASGPRGRTESKGFDANTLTQALQLLQEAAVALPAWAARPATARALRRAVMLEQRSLAQHRLLPSPFRGRRRELAALEQYVETGSVPDRLHRVVLAPRSLPPGEMGAVLVAGIGGTGKSALIEALRRRTARRKKVIFLTFDLDQTSLRSGERVALTMELLRQLGLLLPALDQPLSQIRGELRSMISTAGDDGAKVEIASSAVYSGLSQLGGAIRSAGLGNHTLVLVFDTFEQALVAGQARVRLIADWLLLLRDLAEIPAIRVILSGREANQIAAINGLGLTIQGQINLDDLGTMAGRAKLRDMFRRFGIPHLDLVPALIAAYGSNPLAIEIIAAFCRNRPRDEIAELASDPGEDLRGAFDAEMRQRILYSRILNRIADPDLCKLANPGLVLRRITPQMIEEVLARPCGLPLPLAPGQADALYDALANHVWLVRPALSGDGLEHVPDLRRVMLPQILSLSAAKAVATEAAAWFDARSAGRPGPDLWDAHYYRALIDEDALDGVGPEMLAGMASYLGIDATDLPVKAQAQLREAAGEVLSTRHIAALSGAARSRALRKRQARQMSEGLESAILAEAVGQDGTAPGADDEFAANPDLARAAFANAEFSRLAIAAPGLVATVLGQEPDRLGQEPPDLAHPAWLAAIATLASSTDPMAHARLGGSLDPWLSSPGEPLSTGVTVPGNTATQTLARFAALVAAIAGKPVPLPGTGQARVTFGLAVQTTLDWRYEALIIGRGFSGFSDGVLNVQVAAGVPVLHPVVLEHLLGPSTDLEAPDLPGMESDMLARFIRGQMEKLADVTRATSALDRLTLRIMPQNLPPAVHKALFPGRLPEFHAPLRLLLTGAPPGPALTGAIASVSRSLPWWPRDIGPQLFSGRDLGPTLAGTLIDLLDRAGHLPDLARALAGMPDADGKAGEISGLIDIFCARFQGEA